MPHASYPADTARVAIVDIGSNSLRLVVYDQLKRAAVPLYNEKVMCQLGRGLATSGRLNPEGVAAAEGAVRRFLALSEVMGAAIVHVMATAAVRDAADGREFARALEKKYGVRVDILSGAREARLGAYGICASMYKPSGLSADLGGGSMELVHLEGALQMEHTTLPLGPLRLLDQTGGARGEMRKTIERELRAAAAWLAGSHPKQLYAIGGSFRAIAHLHMEETNYPLHILHHYAVPAKAMAEFARKLADMDEGRLEKLPGLPARRAPAIVPAALLLAYLIETAGPERVVFSGSGIREGYLYEMLPESVQAEDPLLAACRDLAGRKPRVAGYADELMAWMDPLFAREDERERRLREAFCLLADIAHHIHPEYRAPWAMERVLFSAFTGITHRERVLLGLALYHRHQYKLKDEPVLKLVSERGRAWARLLGTCANLAHHLTGGLPGTLQRTALTVEKKALSLVLAGQAAPLAGEAVDRRVSGVAEAYGKWEELR